MKCRFCSDQLEEKKKQIADAGFNFYQYLFSSDLILCRCVCLFQHQIHSKKFSFTITSIYTNFKYILEAVAFRSMQVCIRLMKLKKADPRRRMVPVPSLIIDDITAAIFEEKLMGQLHLTFYQTECEIRYFLLYGYLNSVNEFNGMTL